MSRRLLLTGGVLMAGVYLRLDTQLAVDGYTALLIGLPLAVKWVILAVGAVI